MNNIIDWEITGSLIKNKYNLNIKYYDGKQKTITDKLSNLTKIVKTL